MIDDQYPMIVQHKLAMGLTNLSGVDLVLFPMLLISQICTSPHGGRHAARTRLGQTRRARNSSQIPPERAIGNADWRAKSSVMILLKQARVHEVLAKKVIRDRLEAAEELACRVRMRYERASCEVNWWTDKRASRNARGNLD